MDTVAKDAIVRQAACCEYALWAEARAVERGNFEHAAAMAETAEQCSARAFQWAAP